MAGRLTALRGFLMKKPLGTTGLLIMVFIVGLGLAAPYVAPHDPYQLNRRAILEPPSSTHWFGTDALGRDILSRTIYGARISIFVGLVAMVASAILGAAAGVTSGYFGGTFDLVIQRFVDALTAFPSLLLALTLMAAFGSSLSNVILAITITFAPRITRVIRGVSLSIKETPYIDASRSVGASHLRTMVRHVLPNTFASLVVVSTGLMGSAILIEASLSFLGVGMPVNIISWGSMLSGEILMDFAASPWIGIFPGGALTLLVFGINVFGDALRDVLDPKLRGR